MADTISLTNPGLIPIEAVTTMGVSAKEGENPIGFFGTGLKYAIACLLRTSQKITIWRGEDRYDFAAEPGQVRGKDFDFIRMSGPEGTQRLGFTTHLGAHWETWQVFRELYSNALDEGGDIAFARVGPRDGFTTIWVTGCAFADAARERERYFLNSQPVARGTFVDIHEGASLGVYYRGVLVGSLGRPSPVTYNLTTTMSLTEDRTLKDSQSANYWIAHAIANLEDRPLLDRPLTSGDTFERYLTFSSPRAAFAEAVLDLCERRGVAAIHPMAVKVAEVWAQREARVKAIGLTAREAAEVEDAKAFLTRLGYPVTAPIVVAETLGPDVFGMAKNDTIYLARITINRGGNFLIGTLLEEQLHISHGFHDESRRFQDFLIDLVVKVARDGECRPCEPRPAFQPIRERVAELEEVPF